MFFYRKFTLYLLTLPISVFAEQLASLPQLDGFSSFTTQDNINYVSQCGKSTIHVKNVSQFIGNTFTLSTIDDESMQISLGDRRHVILKQPILSSFNGVACIKMGKNYNILIWNNCDGSLCTDRVDNFFIIDSNSLRLVMPKKPNRSACNQRCASKIVGNKIIETIINGEKSMGSE